MHVCTECGQGYERPGYCAADGHPLAESTDPLIGTEVLRYRLGRLIGRGGMGNLYLGVQPQRRDVSPGLFANASDSCW